jgi:hypothetical protein
MGKTKCSLTRDELVELYEVQKLTTYQIAERYGISNVRVSQLLKKSGIQITPKRRSFEKNKNYVLNDNQTQLMLGGLLGDSYLAPSHDNKSARLQIGHCKAQREYLEWKKSFVRDISGNTNTHVDKDGFVSYSFATKCVPILKEYRDMFYDKNGIKIINRSILDKLSPLGLAIWIMDDGCNDRYNSNLVLYTNCFTLEEQEIIRTYFEETFGVRSHLKSRVYPGNPKRYYFLAFTTRGSRKLSNIIRPFIIDSMKYKLVE